MLSNLSDLLFSRVDPDPVQAPSQTSMVGMSPQSQAMAQQQVAPPAQAKYLQAGQPVKKFNAMTTNMSADNPTGVVAEDKYKALLKGDYTSLNPKDFGGSSEKASMAESDMMKFKRSRMRDDISEEQLNEMLYFREQSDEKRAELKKTGNLSRKQIDEKVLQHIKSLGYRGY
jgi:hypothetical protein